MSRLNPFRCGPNPCEWPCGEVAPPPFDCEILIDSFDGDLSSWNVVSGTPSVSSGFLTLPGGSRQLLHTVNQHPLDPASLFKILIGISGFNPHTADRFSLGLASNGTGDYSQGIEIRVTGGQMQVFVKGVLISEATIDPADTNLQNISLCTTVDRILAQCQVSGEFYNAHKDGTSHDITGRPYLFLDSETLSNMFSSAVEYFVSYDEDLAPDCPPCGIPIECQFCNAETTRRYAAVTFPAIPDFNCSCANISNQTFILEQYGGGCVWDWRGDLDWGVCGEQYTQMALDYDGTNFTFQLQFPSDAYMAWRGAVASPADCSLPRSLPFRTDITNFDNYCQMATGGPFGDATVEFFN